MRRVLSVLISFLLLSVFHAVAGPVRISSQEEFDSLGERIISRLQMEDSVHVKLDSGLYFFREHHLALDSLSFPGVSITVSGAGAVLVGRGTPRQTSAFEQGVVNLDSQIAIDALAPVRKAGL